MKRIAEWFAAVGAAAGRKGKRLVAIVAAVAMLGGVAGVSATAMADDGNASTTQSQTTDEKAAASAPAPLSTEGTNGVPDDPTLSAPAREKTVTANEDGTYTVALNVTGAKSAGTGEIVTNQPLDIVLVLDVSGSMAEKIASGWNQPTKIDSLKTAVNKFINATAAENKTAEYADVTIHDRLSSWVVSSDSASENGEPAGFTYTKTRKGQTTAWADAPEATVAADGTVSWPVTSNDDTLEDGVTYTVSFNVKPTQAAFDEAVKNHKDDANASGDNNFYTNDNSSATVDYKTVVTSSQGGTTTSDPQTAAYPQKPTITLPVSKITVTKTWSDDNENHANDSVQVQLKQDGEDYANGSATLNAAGNWTHEFTVPAGPEGHTYSVSEVKVEGYDSKVDKTDLKLQGLTAQSGAFTVTNTPSYVTLPASDVKVTKVVQGHAANSDFGFNLKCVDSTDANAGKCADVTGLANNGLTTTVSKDELTASGASATVGFGNGDLKFRVPTGADNLVYTFEASEDTEKPAAGWKYDNDKVTVKVTVSRTDAVVSYEYGENDSDRTNTESAQFTNKYVAISSLPLTGGTTGRDWMVFGGGLGLLALLAAAGYTVWRKRQLV